MRITNNTGISLPLAVWLLHDEYDYVDKPNYISATGLMKPLRQIVLPNRIPAEERSADVSEFIARSLGTSIHDSIEKAWKKGKNRALKLLGYPDDVIERVWINPTPEDLRARNDIIPVYLEQRAFKEIEVGGVTYTVGGKFDMVSDGIVNDYKSTSVWAWIKGAKDEDYCIQGSIYRWLNPEKITEDYIRVNFIFTDWSKAMLGSVPNYPAKRVEHKDIKLWSIAETDRWIRSKLELVQHFIDTPEDELPECSDQELWRSDPKFKYFADPAKAKVPGARSSKNFDDLAEARAHMATKGGVGTIVTVVGEPKACAYCAGYEACTQKDQYFTQAQAA
jgi:hypothetical protein